MTSAIQDPAAVPMQVYALWSDGATELAPPSERFSDLREAVPGPNGNFSDAKPWLGDTIHIPTNTAAPLPRGLHLHWILPSGLRRGTTVYAVDRPVANELVQQGVPPSLIEALLKVVDPDIEYGRAEFVRLLGTLAMAGPPLGAGAFALDATARAYSGLIPGDPDVTVETVIPALGWDPLLLDVYGPTIVHTAARTKLPPAPNRWLVVRVPADGGATAATLSVIESDRLTTPDQDGTAPAGAGPTAVPGRISDRIQAWTALTRAEAIDFLGFTVAASGWSEDPEARRLEPFTAVGHGAVDFAAYYLNCQGVFGFHDGDVDEATAHTYTVIGWFSDAGDDPLSAAYAVAPWSTQRPSVADRAAGLSWTLAGGDWSAVDGSVYVASITATGADCGALGRTDIAQGRVTAAIATTPGEALSAFLAMRSTATEAVGVPPESLLNAAQAGVLGDALGADGPALIENALHARGFQSMAGGSTWRVTAPPPAGDGLTGAPQDGRVALSAEACAALSRLNEAQIAFDRTVDAQAAQRRLLFADWCRSLHLETDRSGAVANTPTPNGLSTVGGFQLTQLGGRAVVDAAAAVRAASQDGTDATMAPFLAAAALYLALAAARAALATLPSSAGLRLARQPAPRYWRPNDPVVMLVEESGDDLTVSPDQPLPRKVEGGVSLLLLTAFAPVSGGAGLPAGWDAVPGVPAAAAIGGVLAALQPVTASASWRPLSLQWEAKYVPFPGAGHITGTEDPRKEYTATAVPYQETFIGENFSPDATGIDLEPASGVSPDFSSASGYMGRALLSGHALQTMRTRILQLTGQLQDPPTTSAGLTLPGALAAEPSRSLIGDAYDASHRTLAQALDGFNDALLMQRRASQVSVFDANYAFAPWQADASPVPDPPWDAASQSFYNEIGTQGRSSPDQASGYNPIRAGSCQLTTLMIVDAFGQRREWHAAPGAINTVISNSLIDLTASTGGSAPAFFLSPRYAQASRLLFRWLAAGAAEEVESSQDPEATPVCGWLALNRVDDTILLFLADGTLVGWIAADDAFTPVPGRSIADIVDPWFKQVVAQVQSGAKAFYDGVNQALLTIAPPSHRHFATRSVLESQAVAIARAEMSLQLKGVPQPHQGYEALALTPTDATDPARYLARQTCGFEAVEMPVRLGDVSMGADGLVAYWTIAAGEIAPTYTLVDAGDNAPAPAVAVSPADPSPRQVLLLLDPRAAVHAASGLLPVAEVSIPPEMFSDALGRMQYLMQVSPLLTPAGQVTLPIPAEAPGPWTWLVDEGTGWSAPVTPAKTDDKAHPTSQPAVLRAGYLATQ